MLARFVFSPLHLDKNRKLKSSAFSHVYEKGCSVQRDSVADGNEIMVFLKKFLDSRDDFVWRGLLLAKCHEVRSILVGNSAKRAVCVYDTAEKENHAHGEICQTHYIVDEDDKVELRHNLLMAFGNQVIPPMQYRNGMTWNKLPQDFQARK